MAAALLPALLAGWAGCAHISEVREASPGFTAEALREGGVVVIGVVQVNEVPQVRPPLVEALERVLTATRADIPLVPAARADAALDDSTERILLLGYQMHGTLAQAWLDRAADSLGGLARYGVLARVESDKLRYAVRDAPVNDPTLQSPSGRIRITGRDAHVSVQVYDLKTRERVFAGSYIGAAEVAEPDTMPLVLGEAPTSRNVSMGATPQVAPIDQEYPKPESLARALEPAFLEFARSLPGGPPQR